MNFDLGVPVRVAWSSLSGGGGVAAVMMTPFVTRAGGSGSISGGIGRLLGTVGGKGEGWDELGAVFSVLPEGELLELDFCRR